MAFAVAYLINPKLHVVVPENYIFDLNKAKLKNYGVNSNQTHKVFWSENGEIPSFNGIESLEFPPHGGEGYYRCRILKFFETMKEADEYKLGRRALLPPVYNQNRPNQIPMPCCEFNSSSHSQSNEVDSTISSTESESTNTSDSTLSDYSNASDLGLAGLFDTSLHHEDNVVFSTEPFISFDSVDIQPNFDAIDPLIIMSEDVKPNIEFLKMNSQDAEFIENILSVEDESNCDGSGTNSQNIRQEPDVSFSIGKEINRDRSESEGRQVNMESVEKDNGFWDGVKIPKWEQIDGEGDIYMAPCENMPKPCIKHVDFSVKIDDVISSKMPFATSDDGDRAYIAVHNNKMKVINLSSRVVNGLKIFNGGSFKDVISIDRKFVKALLVCCIGGKEIAQDTLDPIAVSFIRDLYNIRIQSDENRSVVFDDLVQDCCLEIKKAQWN